MTEDEDAPRGQCPSCGRMEKLLPEGDLRSHIDGNTGEYCSGSRGAPVDGERN